MKHFMDVPPGWLGSSVDLSWWQLIFPPSQKQTISIPGTGMEAVLLGAHYRTR